MGGGGERRLSEERNERLDLPTLRKFALGEGWDGSEGVRRRGNFDKLQDLLYVQGIIEIDLIAIRSSSRVALDIKTDLQHSGSAAETGRPSCHWATGPLSKSADGLIETREKLPSPSVIALENNLRKLMDL